MKNRQGITLMILIVTIVLIIILVGTLAVNTGNTVGNSRISAFASDLNEVEDATRSYYMLNDKFPISDNKVYTQGEILTIVPEKYKDKFVEELQLNVDYNTNNSLGTFYKIDLTKLDIDQTTRGLGVDSDGNASESDVFVISYPSMTIYYLEGIRANREVYFSLSSKITQVTNIVRDNTVESGTVTMTTSSGILVKKQEDKWSNKFNVLIETNMGSNEKLYIKFGNSAKHLITTITGNNVMQLQNSFKNIFSNTQNKNISLDVTDEEISDFNMSAQQNKYITITKEKDENEIGKVVVMLENHEVDMPSLSGKVNIKSEATYNYVQFNAKDMTSGVENVRYEYIKEINRSGEIVNYYDNVTSFDKEYMKLKGKKATVSSDGIVEIKLPKNIETIQINMYDKAGNPGEEIIQKVITNEYLGLYENEVTTTSLSLDTILKFSTVQEINTADVQISRDGINYIKSKNIEFENISKNMLYKGVIEYNDLTDIKDVIYVRIVINYGENKTITQVQKFDVNSIKV